MPCILVVTCNYPRICRKVSWGRSYKHPPTGDHRASWLGEFRRSHQTTKTEEKLWTGDNEGQRLKRRWCVHFDSVLLTVTCWFSQKRNPSGQNITVQISNYHSLARTTLQGNTFISPCSLVCVSVPAKAQQRARPDCGHGSSISSWKPAPRPTCIKQAGHEATASDYRHKLFLNSK